MKPTLSTLVVTNRPLFLPWWTWNITKQTRLPDEVIVVTNFVGECKDDVDAFVNAIHHYLSGIVKLKIFACPKETPIGSLRQKALENSHGAVVNFVDDDDWYHPWVFKEFVEGVAGNAHTIVSAPGHYRLLLDDLILFSHGEIKDLIHLPFAAIKGDLARLIKFAPISLNEDIYWLETISSFAQHSRAAVKLDLPIMCVIHGSNTWNSPDKLAHELQIELTGRQLPRAKKPPWGIAKDEWEETWRRLRELREALGFAPIDAAPNG